jgi:GH35 family endo-1,4-beta-xylanase
MDVTLKDNSWASQQEQARIYEDVLGACLANPGVCTAFLTWGFTDKITWLGAAKAPLPFDQWYKPKPAYNSMLSLLNKTESSSPIPHPTPTP